MAHRYRIEPSFGLLIDKFEGKMGWNDMLEGIQRSTNDPKFWQGMNVLADLTAAEMDLRYEGARKLAVRVSMVPTLKFGRIVAVAPGSLQYGVARMFGMLADHFDIYADYRVFPDFAKARTWLRLPQDVELRL